MVQPQALASYHWFSLLLLPVPLALFDRSVSVPRTHDGELLDAVRSSISVLSFTPCTRNISPCIVVYEIVHQNACPWVAHGFCSCRAIRQSQDQAYR
ncbi:hypothetical protein F5Y12DRAFT_771103 [Xylaria sp. FL1777]|nr:hypothetical protein F5Y12DRAFT_771103 [Xylaria sp. FL1777]